MFQRLEPHRVHRRDTLLAASRSDAKQCCAVVEIRQYTLFPEKRDVLVDLFDRYFTDGLTESGMTVIGSFRTLDDPNRFFWIRGFSSMEERGKALPSFYYGPLWKAHRAEANATMVDSDNVLMVRPAAKDSGLPIMPDPGPDAMQSVENGLLIATIYHPEKAVTDDFVSLFEQQIRPLVTRAGARIIGSYVTERSENNFTALPIRNVETFAWFACFPNEEAFNAYERSVAADPDWPAVRRRFAELKNYSPPEVWRLKPTRRSRLRC